MHHDAYFAGFFDGEGCIRIDRIKVKSNENRPSEYTRYQLRIAAAQVSPQPLIVLQKRFGGSITTKRSTDSPKHRTTHTWFAWSKFAYDALVAMKPFLIVKAEEADIAISFYQEMKELGGHFRRYRGNPPDKRAILAKRDVQWSDLRTLKRREYDSEVLEGMMANSGELPCPVLADADGQSRAKQAA
jgi:hypothetical protein